METLSQKAGAGAGTFSLKLIETLEAHTGMSCLTNWAPTFLLVDRWSDTMVAAVSPAGLQFGQEGSHSHFELDPFPLPGRGPEHGARPTVRAAPQGPLTLTPKALSHSHGCTA